GAEERRKNLSGAFSAAARADVCGKSVLLLDDICTTGATLMECAKVLRSAGAKRVYGLVLSSDRN
ncbi:ComF family protein, partial [Schwartzia sp. (in: firmicutes)]